MENFWPMPSLYLKLSTVSSAPPVSPQARVSIVIPTRNRSKALHNCLDSLVRQTYTDFEVIVVDGGSTDHTVEVVQEAKRKLRIELVTMRGGLVPKMNEGLCRARGEFFVRVDDDVVTEPDWLDAVVATFDESALVGGVTGPTIIPKGRGSFRDLFLFQEKFLRGSIFWRAVGVIYYRYFLEGDPFAIGRWFRSGAFSLGSNYVASTKLAGAQEVDHHEACNMAVRTELLRKVGGFDPVYTGLGEFHEPDMSFKIRRMGFKILFEPRAVVFHDVSGGGYLMDRPNSYGRIINFLNFYFKHIRTDKMSNTVRLTSYLLFMDMYWLYGFLRTKQASQLGGIRGTIAGLAKNSLRRPSLRDPARGHR